MSRFFLILLLAPVFFIQPAGATSIPATEVSLLPENKVPGKIPDWITMKVRDFEKFTGKKLSLKEKFAFKILQLKVKRQLQHPAKEKGKDKSKKGQTSMILGIIGLCLLIVPIVNILSIASIPLAIMAIITGAKARKINKEDKMAKTGIILGIITLGLIVLAIILLIALIINGGFWII